MVGTREQTPKTTVQEVTFTRPSIAVVPALSEGVHNDPVNNLTKQYSYACANLHFAKHGVNDKLHNIIARVHTNTHKRHVTNNIATNT